MGGAPARARPKTRRAPSSPHRRRAPRGRLHPRRPPPACRSGSKGLRRGRAVSTRGRPTAPRPLPRLLNLPSYAHTCTWSMEVPSASTTAAEGTIPGGRGSKGEKMSCARGRRLGRAAVPVIGSRRRRPRAQRRAGSQCARSTVPNFSPLIPTLTRRPWCPTPPCMHQQPLQQLRQRGRRVKAGEPRSDGQAAVLDDDAARRDRGGRARRRRCRHGGRGRWRGRAAVGAAAGGAAAPGAPGSRARRAGRRRAGAVDTGGRAIGGGDGPARE